MYCKYNKHSTLDNQQTVLLSACIHRILQTPSVFHYREWAYEITHCTRAWSYSRDELALIKGHVRELLLVASSPAQGGQDTSGNHEATWDKQLLLRVQRSHCLIYSFPSPCTYSILNLLPHEHTPSPLPTAKHTAAEAYEQD